MSTRILAACGPGEARVAVVRDGTLLDYALWRPGAPDGVGDLHRGRIIAHVPAMAGAFVALDGAEGFLPDSEGGKQGPDGTVLGVRVKRAAQGGKGPRLSARLDAADQALVGAGPPALLRRGPGALERLAAAYPDAPVSADDPAVVAELRPVIGPRLGIAIPAWDEALEAAVDALAEPEVMLDEAVRASIHPTPALVAIDIDAGAAVRARGEKTSRHVALNRRILPALAAQIRLRNLSGAILVDFAGLSPRRRAELGPALADALAADPLHPRLLGFTGLGLAEIVRSRVHPPLHELLKGPHAAGLRALRAIASQAAHEPARALVLHAAPAVVRALEADTRALADLRRLAGRPLTLRSDPGLAPEGWFSA